MVCRGRPAFLWTDRAGPDQRRAPARRAGARRRGRGVHAMEFSDAHAGAQDRCITRGWLCHHSQALGRDAGQLRRIGSLFRRGRSAERRAQPRVWRAG